MRRSYRRWVAAFNIVLLVGLNAGCTTSDRPEGRKPSDPAVRDAELIAQADQLWSVVTNRYPEAKRPDVDVVRVIEPDEWATTIVQCLHNEGFVDDKATPDGAIKSGELKTAQVEPHTVAVYVCQVRYPLDPEYTSALNDDQLNTLYDYFVDELKPCLEAEGYSTPPAPSRTKFLETYATTGGWDIYGSVASQNLGQDGWYAINEKCPQLPEGLRE